MTQPATKTVLGRVFHRRGEAKKWCCETRLGEVALTPHNANWFASFEVTYGFTSYSVARELGPTESDAIRALQSTLRKMAELEVAGG